MFYWIAANLIVLSHLGFVCYALGGGFLALRWKWTALLHLPVAIWAALVEFRGWICPLTPLENRFRTLAGEAGYEGGFLEHYLIPVLYPAGLDRELQVLLGGVVVLLNVAVYGCVLWRWYRGAWKLE